MTVTAFPVRDEYTGTAGQTIFNYTFKIYANTDLNVYITPVGQDANDSTDLTTAYTVDPGTIGNETGGFITLSTPVNSGDLVTIVSNIPEDRTTDYQNSGDFLPDTVNADFDRTVSLVKQQEDRASRTLAFPESLQNATALTLPVPDAGAYLAWNSAEDGIDNVGAPGVVLPSELNGTASQMIVNASLLAGDYITTTGYSVASDGGDNVYLARATTGGPYDGGSLIASVGNPSIEFVGLFPNGLYKADQWGGDIAAAITYLGTLGGGKLLLGAKTYTSPYQNPPGGSSTPVAMSVDNITIQGAGIPSYNAGSTALEGGTIIQGNFNIGASGFALSDLGVDVGEDYCNANFAGVPQEGLTAIDPEGAGGAPTATWNNIDLRRFRVLAFQSNSNVHALLVENFSRGYIGEWYSRLGGAGNVVKGNLINIGDLVGGGHDKYTLLIKSESYISATSLNIGNIICESFAFPTPDFNVPAQYDTNGVWIQGASANAEKINIGSIIALGCLRPLFIQGLNGFSCNDINVAMMYCENSFQFPFATSNNCARINIDQLISRNSGDGLNIGPLTSSCRISKATLQNVDGWAYTNAGAGSVLEGCQASSATLGNCRAVGGDLTIVDSPDLNNPAIFSGSVLPTSSTGISFPSPAIASSDPQVLDDYTEQVYTPALTFGGASVGVTYNQQVGVYTKIGRVVYFSAWVFLSNKGSSTGQAEISLPLTSQTVSSRYYGGITVSNYSSLAGITSPIIITVDNNSDEAVLNLGGAAGITGLTDTNFTNTSGIAISGYYLVNT